MNNIDIEEERWFDIMVRRPDEADARIRTSASRLHEPTEILTSTYQHKGDSITLKLEGYSANSDQTMISSGLLEWDASHVLCNYLLTDDDIMGGKCRDILELGSGGLGKCGLLMHHFDQSSCTRAVLTDGDTNALQLLRKNIANNVAPNGNIISCQQLLWGREESKSFHPFLSSQRNQLKFDIIIGSDLLYTNRTNIGPLFETIDELIDECGRFLLAHNEEHLLSVEEIKREACNMDLFCEVLQQEGQIYILCFRRLGAFKVNNVIETMHKRIIMLEHENQALKNDRRYLVDRCKRLDERCTDLRDDDNLPKSILLSFDEDNLTAILSFLKPQDFANLAPTCKFFGLEKHQIAGESFSMMKKIAYKLYEDTTPNEKEALPLYSRGQCPLSLYNEILELRNPLKFDLLFGAGIKHAIRNKSILQPKRWYGYVKRAPGTRYLYAFTAVSSYIMRAGKHFVTFTCNDQVGDPLWFGIVRPLQKLQRKYGEKTIFTPFCSRPMCDLRGLHSAGWGDCNKHCCVYAATSGQCQWSDWGLGDSEGSDSESSNESNSNMLRTEDWVGMQSFDGGTIGLLLDYEEGTLTVFKDGVKLGVMKDGLLGPYSWMVTVGRYWFKSTNEDSVPEIKIQRGTLPVDDNNTAQKVGASRPQKMLRIE